MSAEQAIARIEAAQTPEQIAAVERDMRARAILRASLDTSTGKVALMVAGKAAWHKLGVHIESATDSGNAIVLAGLDWQVDKIPLFYRDSSGTFREQSDVFAIVRRDTGAMLGHVGSRYAPIQNAQGFAFLDSVLGEFGAKYESAGSIYGGSKVFMTVRLPGQDFAVNGSDEVQAYAVLFNPHDGSGVANCFPTSLRPECANTARIAVDRDSEKGIKIRHTGNVATKIESAKHALNLAVKGFDQFKSNAELLAKTALPDVKQYANDVLDNTLDISAADAAKGAELLVELMKPKDSAERATLEKCIGRKIERRQDFINDILERYESRTNGINDMRGSAWSAFNAVTEFSDHSKIGKQSRDEHTRLSRRFESAIAGEGDELKQFAFSEALAYATN
jgi:phage/plasmid-like protein (TIGR03299 family)